MDSPDTGRPENRSDPLRSEAPTASFEDLVAHLHEEADQLYSQRQYPEAEIKVIQFLGVTERAVGKRHPDFALGLSMRGELRFLQGDAEAAERMFEEALEIRRETIGEHHPDFATSLGCLAGLLTYKNRYEEAEKLLRQAHAIRVELFGENHPEAVRGRNELVRLLRRRGQWEAARELLSGRGTFPAKQVPVAIDELAHELVSLSEVIKQLGARLEPVAAELRAGSPLSPEVLEDIIASRRQFTAIREKVKQAVSLQHPTVGNVETLHELAALLDDAYEAKSHQLGKEEVRRRALQVLDRILRLGYAGHEEFPPLVECQERARLLRGAIALANWSGLPAQTPALASGDHVLARLMTLALDYETLNDHAWADHHEFVREALGAGLAWAASRRRLILLAKPAPVPSTARSGEPSPRLLSASVEPLPQTAGQTAEEQLQDAPTPRIDRLEIVFSVDGQQTIGSEPPQVDPMPAPLAGNPVKIRVASDRSGLDGDPLGDLATDMVVANLLPGLGAFSRVEEDEEPLDAETASEQVLLDPGGPSIKMDLKAGSLESEAFSRVPYRRVGPGVVAGPMSMLRPTPVFPGEESPAKDDASGTVGLVPKGVGDEASATTEAPARFPKLKVETLNHGED